MTQKLKWVESVHWNSLNTSQHSENLFTFLGIFLSVVTVYLGSVLIINVNTIWSRAGGRPYYFIFLPDLFAICWTNSERIGLCWLTLPSQSWTDLAQSSSSPRTELPECTSSPWTGLVKSASRPWTDLAESPFWHIYIFSNTLKNIYFFKSLRNRGPQERISELC